MYTISSRYSFNAGHALKKGAKLIESSHKHNWMIEIKMKAEKLDQCGCVVDFRKVDFWANEIISVFEGGDFNTQALLKGRSPSAEVIAEVIFTEMEKVVDPSNALLDEVTVWEDDSHKASFGRF